MIYMDNAATCGQRPDSVISAACAAMRYSANPGRSGHRLSLACMERVFACRKLLNEFFGGYGYERVVFTKNCTEALNIAIFSAVTPLSLADARQLPPQSRGSQGEGGTPPFDRSSSKTSDTVNKILGSGDTPLDGSPSKISDTANKILGSGDTPPVTLVTTVAEHNSVLRPLEHLKKQGVKVEYVPLNDSGDIDLNMLESITAQSHDRLCAAVITLASNVTGTAPDIKRVREILPENCLLICDGAQACGHIRVNMKELGIDALAVAGHKGMLGVQGSGALLFSERFNPSPVTFGGTGSESYNLDMPDFYPDRLESGTLNYPAIISLAEGATYLKLNLVRNQKSVQSMTARICAGLEKIGGAELFSKPNPFGIVAFRLDNMQSEAVSSALSEEFGICVRGGLHCAPLMHEALGSDGLVRVSVSAFTSESDVGALLSAVSALARRKM